MDGPFPQLLGLQALNFGLEDRTLAKKKIVIIIHSWEKRDWKDHLVLEIWNEWRGEKRREIVWNLRQAFRGNFKVVGRCVLWKFFHENMLYYFTMGFMIEVWKYRWKQNKSSSTRYYFIVI